MKQQAIQSVKIIILALLIGLGSSFVLAQLSPSGTQYPRPSNLSGPVNTGSRNQVKAGDLTVSGFLVSPNFARFNGSVSFQKAGTSSLDNRSLCIGLDKKLKVCD